MPLRCRLLVAVAAFALGLLVPPVGGFGPAAGVAYASSSALRPAPPRLNDSRLERLRRGERLVYAEVGEMNRVEGIGIMDVPLDGVVAILRDYPNWVHWYPNKREAVLLRDEGLSATARGELGMPFPFPNRHYTVEVRGQWTEHEGRRALIMTWEYVEGSGNLREMRGFWFLQEWEEDRTKTLGRYVLNVDLGTWLPDAVIRWGQRRMLPGIFDGIQTWHRRN